MRPETEIKAMLARVDAQLDGLGQDDPDTAVLEAIREAFDYTLHNCDEGSITQYFDED